MGRVRTKTVKKVRIRVRPPTPHPARRGVPDPDDDRTPDGKSDPEWADAREGLDAPSPGIPRALPTRRDSLARYDASSALPARFASSSRRRRPQAARPWSHRSRVFRRHAGFADKRILDAGSERVDAERRRAHEALRSSLCNFERPARLWETSSVRRASPVQRASARVARRHF